MVWDSRGGITDGWGLGRFPWDPHVPCKSQKIRLRGPDLANSLTPHSIVVTRGVQCDPSSRLDGDSPPSLYKICTACRGVAGSFSTPPCL